jgi:asparagine synthase (glutamine-hydrolysing)
MEGGPRATAFTLAAVCGSLVAPNFPMCGIAGLVSVDLDVPAQDALARKMIEQMIHRGPDGGGVTAHPAATIGMRRLAIVDIDGGQQPMWSDDESIVIVYNGEIYNAPAIRDRLVREGCRFRTRSDTEVILRLYERDPERVEEELAGMWAFAIHDRKRRRVTLSRDRFGIKPLFVADAAKSLAFASELRCFAPLRAALASTFEPLFALDAGAAHAMIAWAYVPENATIYRGVTRVPPATRIEIDLTTGARTSRTYWRLAPSADAARVKSVDEAIDLVDPLLRRAVREHLESDVPIAAFLSGGIDSSLVTAYAVEESARPITAYSIGFREERFDEAPFARATAEILGVKHRVEILDQERARDAVADAILAYDEPFGDSSSIATLLLARTVAATHKVALAGDGGDEVFAGYRKHKIVRARRMMARFGPVRGAVVAGLRALPARTDRTSAWTEVLRSAKRVVQGLDGSDAEAYAALTQVVPLARAAAFMRGGGDAGHGSAGQSFLDDAMARFTSAPGTELQKTLACDLVSPLANDMLTKVDRATMAVSLEARVPFLDHRLVEAGVGLPMEITSGKRVLKAMHERRFGSALANRKKMGFGVPVETWLRGPLAPTCDVLFARARLERDGLLAAETLSDGRWRAWAAAAPQVLWHVFALAAWCEATRGAGPGFVREVLNRAPSR